MSGRKEEQNQITLVKTTATVLQQLTIPPPQEQISQTLSKIITYDDKFNKTRRKDQWEFSE